jgi:hypothetical protein
LGAVTASSTVIPHWRRRLSSCREIPWAFAAADGDGYVLPAMVTDFFQGGVQSGSAKSSKGTPLLCARVTISRGRPIARA